MKELKQSVGIKIDYGNRMLGMDLVPRDDSGAPIDPKTAGVMHLYRTVSGVLYANGKTVSKPLLSINGSVGWSVVVMICYAVDG